MSQSELIYLVYFTGMIAGPLLFIWASKLHRDDLTVKHLIFLGAASLCPFINTGLLLVSILGCVLGLLAKIPVNYNDICNKVVFKFSERK